jgi:hypothetical protein
MSTTIIPESLSPQLKIALRWLDAFNESNYEISDLADDFLQTTAPSSTHLPQYDKDEYVENLLQYRAMFNDDVVVCPYFLFP